MVRFIKQHHLSLVIIVFLLYSSIAIYKSSFIVLGTRYFLLSDDIMIQMKYAYNFIHGYGLVWNAAGPRVEGITDPLWVIYLGLLHLIPLPPSKISILVQFSGALFMASSLYFVKKIADLVSNSSLFVVFLSLIFTAFYFPLINWSVILGTEISIMTLFLTATVYLTLKTIKNKKFSLLLFFVFGVGTLIRMDFFLPAAIMTAYLIIFDSKNRKKYFAIGIPIILLFVATQEILTYWYYHELLPNTYYLRLAGYPILPRITRGLLHTKNAFLLTILSLNLFIVLFPYIGLYFTKNKKLLLLLAVFTGEIFYNIYLGGDSWEHYGGANHFYAFVMPLFFISLFMTMNFMRQKIVRSIRFGIEHKILEIILMCFIFLIINRSNEHELPQLFLIKQFPTVKENWVRVVEALQLNEVTTPSAKIVVSGAGIISYFAHGYFIDALGKNDKVIAREPAHIPKKFVSLFVEYTYFYSGHMKWDYPYILKTYKPDIITELYGNFEWEDNRRFIVTHGYELLPNTTAFYGLKGSKNIISNYKKLPIGPYND